MRELSDIDSGGNEDLIARMRCMLEDTGFTEDAALVFRRIIYEYYRRHRRMLPWRQTPNPYHILVSEIMLQQTQVERVIPKYELFIREFPDFCSLANAPLRKILRVWQGLGYNRRAMALKEIAGIVVNRFDGELPSDIDVLMSFPGIGRATASEIAAFAFERPCVFIETNIRRVFIHFFFHDEDKVRDADILPLVQETLDAGNTREWYYALMDYGAMLKKKHPNPNRRSAHYQKQSPFEGSDRQIRGMILKVLVARSSVSEPELIRELDTSPENARRNIARLQEEGFVKEKQGTYTLA